MKLKKLHKPLLSPMKLPRACWKPQEDPKEDLNPFSSVVDSMGAAYMGGLLPLEQRYGFHHFHSSPLEPADFHYKPLVLVVGQYSTGKTSLIRYLLGEDYPGLRIGPEPTTDCFMVVSHNHTENLLPGNAVVAQSDTPFKSLSKFGLNFLNKLKIAQKNIDVLKSFTIVDTPGILSGDPSRLQRGYDFQGVLHWFAERSDRIVLLFDTNKLDVSDEFRIFIAGLRNHRDKMRLVLNKADSTDTEGLMRSYGALMWSLGQILQSNEVEKVFVGSFWNHGMTHQENKRLFEAEEQDLFFDLQSLPRNAALRKLNDLIKRARLAKVHAYIISELKKEMPAVFGKDNKKKELIKRLASIYEKIQREHQISPGDFPDIKRMQEQLAAHDFTKFAPLKPRLLENVDKMLAEDIARLMALIPQEEAMAARENGNAIKGGAFDGVMSDSTVFGFRRGEGIDAGSGEPEWIVAKDRHKYDQLFIALEPSDGKLTGSSAKAEMVKSKLPNSVLGKVWKLSDLDKDGMLDIDEFALSMHLINVKLDGHDLPNDLPEHLVPPSKRGFQA